MAHVMYQRRPRAWGASTSDCVVVCPVECFYGDEQQLYIDPDDCLDCQACVPECPVEAIFLEPDVPAKWSTFVQLNADRVLVLKPLKQHRGDGEVVIVGADDARSGPRPRTEEGATAGIAVVGLACVLGFGDTVSHRNEGCPLQVSDCFPRSASMFFPSHTARAFGLALFAFSSSPSRLTA